MNAIFEKERNFNKFEIHDGKLVFDISRIPEGTNLELCVNTLNEVLSTVLEKGTFGFDGTNETISKGIQLEVADFHIEEMTASNGKQVEVIENLQIKTLSVGEVSEVLEISPQLVRRYCRDGKITGVQSLGDSGKWSVIVDEKLEKMPKWSEYNKRISEIKANSRHAAENILSIIREKGTVE